MVVTSVSSAGIPSSYLPSVAAYHQLHSGQPSCQCCLFSTKLKYWSFLPVLWLCLALSVILCAMMQQNRTCTKDQATPTKCFFLLCSPQSLNVTTVTHDQNTTVASMQHLYQPPCPLPFHYNLPESAAETISVFGRDVFWS